jgi:predicted ATPase/DNA-binding CsgD family transcriptional regulator
MQDNIFMLPWRQAQAEPGWKVPNNLPAQLTPLVGRESEVTDVCTRLRRPEVRLLTLTGTGGVGKTRLATAVATDVLVDFADGVSFVSLAPLSQPDLVLPALTQTLDLKETSDWLPLEHLKAYLHEKQLLLVLDNFEQVITAAPLLVALLQACPALKMLVTSRARLRVSAEHEFRVPALALPDLHLLPGLAVLQKNAAVTLLLQRAQALKPDFLLTADNARDIAEICLHLDGLPLAIELAAARLKLLSPQDLLARLSHRLQVLTSGVQDAPARQQTLRNTIQWSYDLLTVEEQCIFRRLAVFVAGCTLEAADAVCAAFPDSVEQVLEGVSSLLDKSLLQQNKAEVGEPRLAQEQENMRAALGWLLEHGETDLSLRLSGTLWWFWFLHGDWSEGRRWLETSLQLPSTQESTSARARALSGAGELAWSQGDQPAAQHLLSESISLSREVGDEQGLAVSHGILGLVLQEQGELDAGRTHVEEGLALCRQHGYTWDLARLLLNAGHTVRRQGNYPRAVALYQEGLSLARELGDKRFIAVGLNNLGYTMFLRGGDLQLSAALAREALKLARELWYISCLVSTLDTVAQIVHAQGDVEQAKAHYLESLSLALENGYIVWAGERLLGLARVAESQGEFVRAARLLGAAQALIDVNKHIAPAERATYERFVACLRTRLEEETFAAAWQEGRSMTPQQALSAPEEAVSPIPAIPPPLSGGKPAPARRTAYPAGLTAREMEVLQLVAQGMTNPQIAERLIISFHTVNAHVRSIYTKLDVNSRSALTRYALEHHLL